MCSEQIADEHQHVVNVAGRQLMCVCRGCYLLFTDPAAELRYRSVPDRYLALPGRRPWTAARGRRCRSRSGWRSSSATPHWTASSPSIPDRPARTNPNWTCGRSPTLTADDARLASMADDVEALLIRVPDSGAPECFLVPIDACYEFVGGLRMLWRGFDGGQQAREFIDGFFAQVAHRSKTVPP